MIDLFINMQPVNWFGFAGLVACIAVDSYLIIDLKLQVRREKHLEFIEYSQDSLDKAAGEQLLREKKFNERFGSSA